MSLTELVLMPGEDYQRTCDTLRQTLGAQGAICSGQLPEQITQVYAAGAAASEEKWNSRFYTTYVRGNGDCDFSAPVPFRPDRIIIGVYDPVALTGANGYIGLERDFRTFAKYGGLFRCAEGGTYSAVNLRNNTIENFIRYEDGQIRFLSPSGTYENLLWRPEVRYRLIAIKYADREQTDRELLEDYIASLPDTGGTVTISSRRFGETGMTEEEFDAFTKEWKPSWTFVLE